MKARVTIHAGPEIIDAALSTDASTSSYGLPVLLIGGDTFGVADHTPHGRAACLVLEAGGADGRTLLRRWEEIAGEFRSRTGLPTLAESWLRAGGWEDGSAWRQTTDEGEEREIVEELGAAPAELEAVDHIVGEDTYRATAWIFRDGSGVVEIEAFWDVFSPDGTTATGRVET